mgnify:CR=1 FL=1
MVCFAEGQEDNVRGERCTQGRTVMIMKDRHKGVSDDTVMFPFEFSHTCTYGCAPTWATATTASRSNALGLISNRVNKR